MKMLKLAVLSALLALGAVSAQAATVWVLDSNKAKTFVVHRALIQSPTTPSQLGPVETKDPAKNVTIYLKGSTSNISVTVSKMLDDGTVVESESINVGTTYVSRTILAPLPFEKVGVSVTSALGTSGNVSATVILTK